MIIEKTVLIDKWLLINADDKASWKYLFLIDGKLRGLSEAEELYNQFKNQPDRLNPEERQLMEDLGMIKIIASPISMDYFTLCDSQNCDNK